MGRELEVPGEVVKFVNRARMYPMGRRQLEVPKTWRRPWIWFWVTD